MSTLTTPMSAPWTAEQARARARSEMRPVVTRVDKDMWVMYPPSLSLPVRGGYPADTAQQALSITRPIALRRFGLEPLVIDALLVTGMERKPDAKECKP